MAREMGWNPTVQSGVNLTKMQVKHFCPAGEAGQGNFHIVLSAAPAGRPKAALLAPPSPRRRKVKTPLTAS